MAWVYPVRERADEVLNPGDFTRKRGYYSDARRDQHWGLDMPASTGHKVRAPRRCRVVATGSVWGSAYGLQVLLRYRTRTGRRCWLFAAHLSHIAVEAGERVNPGDIIGLAGATGQTFGAHVHWEWATTNRFDTNRLDLYPVFESARKRYL